MVQWWIMVLWWIIDDSAVVNYWFMGKKACILKQNWHNLAYFISHKDYLTR